MNPAGLDDETLDQLLDAIEECELRGLRWGYSDGSLSYEEILRIARVALSPGEDPEELLNALVERALLVELPGPGGAYIYRSRFAEGVRLMASLRQLFPWRPSWIASPSLVSDFRVDWRPRRYPRRDLPGEETIGQLAKRFQWSLLQQKMAATLVSSYGRPLDLSGFQARATEAIFESLASDAGIVISAGTGSGKTLAYYLPALIAIAERVRAGEFWTKSISLYPRNELLKDQFTEAYRLARVASPLLPRPLRIATFFGPTPNIASFDALARSWEALGPRSAPTSFVCPFLVCPDCGGRMVWLSADVSIKRERLVCEHSLAKPARCSTETDPDAIALTRESARSKPPDALFTTIETLNQRMSDPQSRRVLGLGVRNRPFLLLLDEVHTYEGTSGAQAAMVLRRWRHALGSRVLRVGLSATLAEAQKFFAQVAGVPDYAVREVTPLEHEYEHDAAEYQLILRGDPVSQVALLSTSIQAGFLLARLLDPPDSEPSYGRLGKRVFVFTDDLDVTNRLYDDLQDAERPGNSARAPLAALRAGADDRPRLEAGQDWRSLERIGWDLRQPLLISRTSSQDAGVNRNSQVVVATASLEVGYNDNRVGAVLQHKAPYRASSFVQRKGRAGRTRKMRPWTVTVLSDYGRDRLIYQYYESLFDPLLPPQRLPVENQYILRIQASFAAIEWLALRHPRLNDWWWWTINGPSTNQWQKGQQFVARQTIEKLLDGDSDYLESLRSHVQNALSLSDEIVASILWEPPRSLLLEFFPTLLRRLQAGWRLVEPQGSRPLDLVYEAGPPNPAPEFLPPNLFTDLNLPEVGVAGPDIDEGTTMMIEQALRQLAPGRITRRFAHRSPGLYHWIPVPLDLGDRPYLLPIDDYASDFRLASEAPLEIEGTIRQVRIYRPWLLALSEARTSQSRASARALAPRAEIVSPTSNASLLWCSQLLPTDQPIVHRPLYDRTWRNLIGGLEFHTHSRRAPIIVRRFALEAVADVRIPGVAGAASRQIFVQTQFCEPGDDKEPAAIGFEMEVDALCFHFNLPTPQELAERAATAASLPTWRVAYMRQRIQSSPDLPRSVNIFLRDWLHQIYLSALVGLADELEVDLAAAANELAQRAPEPFEAMMDSVFQVRINDSHTGTDPLRDELRSLLRDQDIVRVLATHAEELWSPNPEEWQRWLGRSLHETLGQGAALACMEVAPLHIAEDSLLLDLERGLPGDETGDRAEVWLSETALGGAGAVEAIAAVYADNPRRLFRAFEASFVPTDHELTSKSLLQVLRLSQTDKNVRDSLRVTRAARNPLTRDTALRELYALLASRGVFVDHALSVALNQRLLREGTDEGTDLLLSDLIEHWQALEERLGVAIDLRVFSYFAVRSSAFAGRIETVIGRGIGQPGGVADRVGVLAGLLWPRPGEIREHALSHWSPFRANSYADAALVRELILTEETAAVSYGDNQWEQLFREKLCQFGKVDLVAAAESLSELQQAVAQLIAIPVDDGYLQFHPSIERFRNEGNLIVVTFVIRAFG